jgi:hypothetical protein
MAQHKLSTAVFAQGWLEGQFETMVARSAEKADEDPTVHLVATQVLEQWNIVSNAFDQLVKENAELERRLALVKAAVL